MQYSTVTLPCFVLDYVGRKGATLTRQGRSWTLSGETLAISVMAGSACHARLIIADQVDRLDQRADRRRRSQRINPNA